MKQFFLCLAATSLMIACNNEKKTDEAVAETKADQPTVALPYTAAYSSSFTPGNPEYSTMILQGSWKDWELNKMDNMKSWVADTIMVLQADNTMVMGVDSLQARWIKGRAGYSSVIDTVHAVTAIYSTDKKENWVLVWAKEINVDTKGKKDTVELMETWRINKDGKADMLLQYDRHARKK